MGTKKVANKKAKGPNKHSGGTNQLDGRKAKVPTKKKNLSKRSVETTASADASGQHADVHSGRQPSPDASDEEYIPDPHLSDGEKEGPSEMLSDGERLTKKQRCVAPPKRQKTNVACRVEHYLSVVRSLSHRKRSIVRQMGFESLLDFNVTRLNRKFCMWLYKHFDPFKGALVLDDEGHDTILVKPNQVSWVLGVPMNGRVVPKERSQLNKVGLELLEKFKSKFGFQKEIPSQPVLHELTRDDVTDSDFKRAFLLFILGTLLCPTQSTGISPDLLPAATVALNCQSYAWGQFIHEWLCKCGQRFQKDMDKVAGPQGAGGCALVLMILYLDRKPLPVSVNFYRTPRLLAWSDEAVDAAIEADTIDASTYGKAMFLPGVSYGHPHPSEGLDMPWSCPPGLQWSSTGIASGTQSWKDTCIHPSTKDNKEKPSAFSPPAADVVVSDAQPLDTPTGKTNILEGFDVGGTASTGGIQAEEIVADIQEDTPIKEVIRRSRARRKQVLPNKGEDYYFQPIHKHGHTMDQKRVLLYLDRSQSDRRPSTRNRKTAGEGEELDSSDIVFQLGGHFCTLHEVQKAVLPGQEMDSSFVKGISLWMNSQWNEESSKTSPRFILDPSFMQSAITKNLVNGVPVEGYDISLPSFLNSLDKVATTLKSSTDWQQCSIIFLPCCLQKHWFCFAFNFRDKRVEVLDSMHSLDHYENTTTKEAVVNAFKMLISHFDPSFNMDTWEFRDADVPEQHDGHSCGHYMVVAISLWNGNWTCIKSEIESHFKDGCRNLVSHMLVDNRNEVRDVLMEKVRRYLVSRK